MQRIEYWPWIISAVHGWNVECNGCWCLDGLSGAMFAFPAVNDERLMSQYRTETWR